MTVLLFAAALAAAQPQAAVTIDPRHRLVEGVASDGRTIWVSSVLDRTILECRDQCRSLAVLPAGLHPLGIAWDSSRKRLWIAADCPKLPGIAACERGAVVAIDQRGRIRSKIAPGTGLFHPGDVSADRTGVFASDSQSGTVYRLMAGGRALVAIVAPGTGKSGQGSAVDASGRRLIVADYSQGIAAIDLATNVRTLLPRQDGKPLRGVDGLARCGDTFFGTYNGASPGRLLAIRLRPTVVEFGEPMPGLRLPDPTQVAFDGRRLLIVSDAGWELAGKGVPRTAGAPILAMPLDKECRPL